MVKSSSTYENYSIIRNAERFYLDFPSADVVFLCIDDINQVHKIPAHKTLLSICSPVFEAMFYGPLKEKNEIPIVDASADAFREFLQFFYFDEVTLELDAENLFEVMNLCKKYQLNDCLNVCVMALKDTLTNEDMCWGYQIAILMELDELKRFCEQKIQENAEKILKSDSFLDCDKKTFDKILKLVHFNCEALVIVGACMLWAEAECERKGLDGKLTNIKEQFGDSFSQIPFDELTRNQYKGYSKMFSRILRKYFRRDGEIKDKELKCYKDFVSYDRSFTFSISGFTFDKPQNSWMTSIYFGNNVQKFEKSAAKLTFDIHCTNHINWLASGYINTNGKCSTLSKPIRIKESCTYSIRFKGFSQESNETMTDKEKYRMLLGFEFEDANGETISCEYTFSQ